jgi:toxin ParE1/3/4
MPYSVVFTPEAEEHLVALYRYIANDSSPVIAERFTSAIVEFCEGLANFPQRSVRRARHPTRAICHAIPESSSDRVFRG